VPEGDSLLARVAPLYTFVFYFVLGTVTTGPAPAAAEAQLNQQQTTPSKPGPAEVSQLRRKAEQGDAAAQFALGKVYQQGNGVTKNDDLAFKWYRKAADQGNAPAENMVGVMYGTGEGVRQDREEAVRWYGKAAKHGNPEGMFNMGVSYYNGEGARWDPISAYAWFLLAQDAGSAPANEAVQRSAEERGQFGTRDAILQIAGMYERGEDLPQSYSQAAKWYRKAVDLSPEAAFKLALLLVEGKGVAQDFAQAMGLCRCATERGYSQGQVCVGDLYRHGLGVPVDGKEAIKWFERAGELGNRQGFMLMADMYWKGEGVSVDRAEAYFCLYRASQIKGPDVRPLAGKIRQEMTNDDVQSLEAKLHRRHLDPQKVYILMQEEPAPKPPSN